MTARAIRERAHGDRAGGAAGAGGGPQSPSRPARRRHSGQGVERLLGTGTKSAVVGDPSPAPAASPVRRTRETYAGYRSAARRSEITAAISWLVRSESLKRSRKASRSSVIISTSVIARTLAMRGRSCTRPISPK